jgi:hypothetical protein
LVVFDSGEMLDDVFAVVIHLEVTEATYRAAVTRWPAARITLRHGTRIVHESGQQVWLTR